MAWATQDNKKEKQAALKKIIPSTWKWSMSAKWGTMTLTIQAAPVDLIDEINRVSARSYNGHFDYTPRIDNAQLNEYHLDRQLDKHLPLFQKIKDAMNIGNHNRSDSQTDYFDVGWYISINIGRWNKPFNFTGKPTEPCNDIQTRIAALESEQIQLKTALDSTSQG